WPTQCLLHEESVLGCLDTWHANGEEPGGCEFAAARVPRGEAETTRHDVVGAGRPWHLLRHRRGPTNDGVPRPYCHSLAPGVGCRRGMPRGAQLALHFLSPQSCEEEKS